MTADQLRRLFFRREDGRLATPQTVNTRLRRLVDLKYLDVLVVDRGRGAGPYAYGLGPRGQAVVTSVRIRLRKGVAGQVWHHLELAEFRVRLEESLGAAGGALVEWLGDVELRALLWERRGWPVPDGLMHRHWRAKEGSFLMEWDRSTESLAVLTAKLQRYGTFARARGHRTLLPGLGLRPRLAIVVRRHRFEPLVRWIQESRRARHLTVAVGASAEVLRDPLGPVWWRSDLGHLGSLLAD